MTLLFVSKCYFPTGIPSDLYNAMESFANSENTDSNPQLLCEKIKLMTEYQIWGEKNDDTFFE